MPKLSNLSPYHRRLIRMLRRKNALLENDLLLHRRLCIRYGDLIAEIKSVMEFDDPDRIGVILNIDKVESEQESAWEARDVAAKAIKRKFNRRKKDDL